MRCLVLLKCLDLCLDSFYISFTFVNLRAESLVFVIVDGVQQLAVLEPVHRRLVGIGHQQLAIQGAQVQSLITSGQALNIITDKK